MFPLYNLDDKRLLTGLSPATLDMLIIVPEMHGHQISSIKTDNCSSPEQLSVKVLPRESKVRGPFH